MDTSKEVTHKIIRNDILPVFNKIHKFYCSFCSDKANETDVNTNSEKVIHIPLEDLMKKATDYCRKLNAKNDEISNIFGNPTNTFSYRIKNDNSIYQKLRAYKEKKEEKGEILIRKCLNDLLGFRIICPLSMDGYEEVKEVVNARLSAGGFALNLGLKCEILPRKIVKLKTYRAIHVYIRDGCYTFPWELQIWNNNDEQENLESHELYKQQYTKLEGNATIERR